MKPFSEISEIDQPISRLEIWTNSIRPEAHMDTISIHVNFAGLETDTGIPAGTGTDIGFRGYNEYICRFRQIRIQIPTTTDISVTVKKQIPKVIIMNII